MRIHPFVVTLSAVALTASVSACGSDAEPIATAATAASASSSPPADESAAISMSDPWIKAAKDGMTAGFGTLVNDSDSDVVVTAADSDITGMLELHQTVENDDGGMAMEPTEGGFTVAAGSEHELAPGGDHLMIMDLSEPLKPGEVVTITLTMEDGSTADVEATVKSFDGADEEYQNDDESMADMDQDTE